ncbi:WhiB family transcriptional regulator [Kitasatospora sp. NPDC006697]|uniref:WhiB family transcriptional regulator n=1 Tax=Kitasatospora sp. NPDC006697 TaxID=3364020 RepID=UPI0036AB72F4
MVLHYMRAVGVTVDGPIHGTRTAHLTPRPTGPDAFDFAPDAAGALPGAACGGAAVDLWFGRDEDELAELADGDDEKLALLRAEEDWSGRRAKAICSACPVRAACLAGALERREQFGVFGGLTADERRAVLRRRYRDSVRAAGTAVAG